MQQQQNQANSGLVGVGGTVIAIGILVFILNAMYIRELMRPAGERFEANPKGVKYYPNRRVLRYLLIVSLVFTMLGSIGYIAGGSLMVGAAKN